MLQGELFLPAKVRLAAAVRMAGRAAAIEVASLEARTREAIATDVCVRKKKKGREGICKKGGQRCKAKKIWMVEVDKKREK